MNLNYKYRRKRSGGPLYDSVSTLVIVAGQLQALAKLKVL